MDMEDRMTSLGQALRTNDQLIAIAGKLVSKHIFHRGDKTLLVITILDEDGKSIEIKSWSYAQAYHVYGKFDEEEDVYLVIDRDLLDSTDPDYTQAKFETISSSWRLFPVTQYMIRPKNHYHCWTNLRKYQKSRGRPAASIMGLFRSMQKGPPAFWQGEQVARGYFVKLLDDECVAFYALVWKSLVPNTSYKFALDHVEINDHVLIVNAREQIEQYGYRCPNHFVVTTTYPPIVNSNCVSPAAHNVLDWGLKNA